MAPAPDLSPPGSSSYSSNTMMVGDGTWDSSKNDFLLPNLVGLNFETMQYNGMGNRFSTLAQYHTLILGHGVLAAITFLFILPASVMYARFYGKIPGRGVQNHIQLNIVALFLATVVFILGNFAVGPNRALTNPHHGIGTAIYVLMLVQALGGRWVRSRLTKHPPSRPPIKLMLHQWIGRATVLLGIIQVALGLTLYGSPKFTFVLYTLWMTFLLILYFILQYRADGVIGYARHSSHGGGTTTVIEEKKSNSGIRRWILPLLGGAALAAFFNRRRKERREEREEVISSRRGSRRGSRRDDGSYTDEDKESDRREGGGIMGKLLGGAAVLGVGALAKNWWDNRRRNREEETYASVAPDTPSRRRRPRDEESDISRETVEVRRVEHGRRPGEILPGPVDPVLAAGAISAADGLPATPRPIRHGRRYSNESYSTDQTPPPRREEASGHGVRNSVLAGLGLGWLAKKYKDRRDRQEEDRVNELRTQDIEEERRHRHGSGPSRYTGDGTPRRPSRRRPPVTDSDISSDMTSRVEVRPSGLMPPLPAGAVPGAVGAAAALAAQQSRSRHDIINPVPMPPGPPRDDVYVRETVHANESGSDAYVSGGTHERRRSSRRGREAAAAAAGATAGAALATAAEEERRRRDQSQAGYHSGGGDSQPAVSLKMKMHGDPNRNVTLRVLTEQERAAQRAARNRSQRARADSTSSLSAAEEAPGRRRYRRDSTRRDEIVGEPLSPPRPAFAGGRQPKDSAYYSGPGRAGTRSGPESLGSPESHGTWSGMSPTGGPGAADEDPAERRRRRRMERNQRQASERVDFS